LASSAGQFGAHRDPFGTGPRGTADAARSPRRAVWL